MSTTEVTPGVMTILETRSGGTRLLVAHDEEGTIVAEARELSRSWIVSTAPSLTIRTGVGGEAFPVLGVDGARAALRLIAGMVGSAVTA